MGHGSVIGGVRGLRKRREGLGRMVNASRDGIRGLGLELSEAGLREMSVVWENEASRMRWRRRQEFRLLGMCEE